MSNVQRRAEKRLSAVDDPAQLREGGLLGRGVVVVTPGNDFEHLSSHIAFSFPDSIETAPGAPVFVVDHSGLRRCPVPITIKNVQRSPVVFENVGADRQGDVVDGKKFVLHAAALLHATGGKANIWPVILDKKTGGATREPAKEKHVPLVAVVSCPDAAAALVVAQKLLSALGDRDRFPIRCLKGPFDGPRLEPRHLCLVGAIPNLCGHIAKKGSRQKRAQDQTRE